MTIFGQAIQPIVFTRDSITHVNNGESLYSWQKIVIHGNPYIIYSKYYDVIKQIIT